MTATVIRAGETARGMRGLRTVDLADHMAEARAIVERAQVEAESIRAAARAESEHAGAKAHGAGYDVGFREGEKNGREFGHRAAYDDAMVLFKAEQTSLIADFHRIVDDLDARKHELQSAGERHVLELAVAIAGKLTLAIGEVNRDAVLSNLRRAMELVGAKTNVVVRTNPRDLESMSRFAEDARQRTQASSLSLVADEAIAPGGCIVESQTCQADATLETQIEEIVSVLLGRNPRND